MSLRVRSLAVVAAAATVAATAAACTAGTSGGGSGPSANAKQTITVWHGFTDNREVSAFEANLKSFHAKHPNITIKAVKGQDDDKITQAIRGGHPPDVAVSFTTDNVGQFCSSGAWQDLTPYLKRDHVDMGIFPKAVRQYTSYQGKQCALPMLADAYGLYYNKKLLAAAGYHHPPRTISELTTMAKKLTKRAPDGTIKVAGFIPDMQYYENTPSHFAPSWGATWFANGKSNLSKDPAWTQMLNWQKQFVDWYGYNNLEKFRQGLGQEFSADNPFEVGKVAMAVDGEWRTAMIGADHPSLDYGTAPFPMADNLANEYGAGYISGTIIGIPRGTQHAAAAWELVKYLTTDTNALVSLANKIHNVPSTLPSLDSPKLTKDPRFRTFLTVFGNPHTSTTPASPNGGAYQTTFQEFINKWQAGQVPNLHQGLAQTDKQIDQAIALSAK